jgi:uncharacterized protein (TIGR00661 family)
MSEINVQRNILVAPLNWGLGHATRCIPIIKALEIHGFTPILASDGPALLLLEKEFPHLTILELPSYEIGYAKTGENFRWKMLKNFPKMADAIIKEKKVVKEWVKEHNLCGIISDNRFGVIHKNVPSVFITHQLNVLSGSTTWISGKVHRATIKKFSECWVPDVKESVNLSGKLGHLKMSELNLKYIGPLSRFERQTLPVIYDLMVILSGPEPQRSYLENILKAQLVNFTGRVIFIRGVIEKNKETVHIGNVTYNNFMTSEELERTFNESSLVLCRSGYTTIMDLAKLGKKAFFIPTPGQYEQEYLAEKLKTDGQAPSASQKDFDIGKLAELDNFYGLDFISQVDWKSLFRLFQRE